MTGAVDEAIGSNDDIVGSKEGSLEASLEAPAVGSIVGSGVVWAIVFISNTTIIIVMIKTVYNDMIDNFQQLNINNTKQDYNRLVM